MYPWNMDFFLYLLFCLFYPLVFTLLLKYLWKFLGRVSMWIARSQNRIFNMDHCRDVFVSKNTIVFWENASTSTAIVFDNEKEAEQNFKYIVEGLKNKSLLIFI